MDTLIDHAGVSRITPKGFRHTARSVGWVVVDDDKVMRERLAYADIGITRGDVHPHGHRPAPRGGRSLG
jgi:hypothetical protein